MRKMQRMVKQRDLETTYKGTFANTLSTEDDAHKASRMEHHKRCSLCYLMCQALCIRIGSEGNCGLGTYLKKSNWW
jgi:hypothetical protein